MNSSRPDSLSGRAGSLGSYDEFRRFVHGALVSAPGSFGDPTRPPGGLYRTAAMELFVPAGQASALKGEGPFQILSWNDKVPEPLSATPGDVPIYVDKAIWQQLLQDFKSEFFKTWEASPPSEEVIHLPPYPDPVPFPPLISS